MTNENATHKPIRSASTVVLLREAPSGIETFMLCRHGQSGFMGGAHVFPGGKIDEADAAPDWNARVDRPIEDLAALLGEAETDGPAALGLWVGAIRETFEEAGVLLASTATPRDLSEQRNRLEAGASFQSVAEALDLSIQVDALTPYARWVTPKMESKRYDTRFFIATLPEGQVATHDGTETTSAVWLQPGAVLDGMHAGRIKLAPPTVRTLQWLADFDATEAVVRAALSRKPPLVRPEIVSGSEGWFLALPGDPKHPEDVAVLPGSTRMVMQGGAWIDAPMPVV